MNMDLYDCNAETLSAKVGEMTQLLHGGVSLADYHTLTQGSTTGNLRHLACFLVYPFPLLGLHSPACLFLD